MLALLAQVSWPQWRHHPWRHAAALLAVTLGVALAFSVQLINQSALGEFSAAVASVNGEPDFELRGQRGGFDEALYARVAAHPQVALASPLVELETLAAPDGAAAGSPRTTLRVLGIDALVAAALSPALLPRLDAGAGRSALFDPGAVALNASARRQLFGETRRVADSGGGASAAGVVASAASGVSSSGDAGGPPTADRTTRGATSGATSSAALDGRPANRPSAIRVRTPGGSAVLRVHGSVTAGGAPLAVMDIAGAQAAFGWLGRLSRIDVRLVPGADRDAVVASLKLADFAAQGVRAASPGEATQRISNLSRAYRVNLTVLALVALFTGAFLVFSILALSVAKRQPELALLGVLGLSARERLRLVLAESALLGAAGGVLGLLLGTALAALALRLLGGDLGGGYFPGVAPSLHFSAPAAAVYGALGVVAALVGGWLPARAAQRIAPAQALKGLGDATGSAGPAWFGPAALAVGVALCFAPPLFEVPLAAYVAVALLLLGGIACVPAGVGLLLWLLRPANGAGLPRVSTATTATAATPLRLAPPAGSAPPGAAGPRSRHRMPGSAARLADGAPPAAAAMPHLHDGPQPPGRPAAGTAPAAPRRPRNALLLLAVERARHQRQTATIAVAGVVASLSLAVALTVMVTSFRGAITEWLDVVLPADLYARAAAPGNAGNGSGASGGGGGAVGDLVTLSTAWVDAAARLPGVARVEAQRVSSVQLDAQRPSVALIARPLADPARALPLTGELLPMPAGRGAGAAATPGTGTAADGGATKRGTTAGTGTGISSGSGTGADTASGSGVEDRRRDAGFGPGPASGDAGAAAMASDAGAAATASDARSAATASDARSAAMASDARAAPTAGAASAAAMATAASADGSPRAPLTAVYVSEAMVDLYGAAAGSRFVLPLPDGSRANVYVRGVWRDYARQFGAVTLDAADYRRLTGDTRVNDLALWLTPGTDPAGVQAALRRTAGTLGVDAASLAFASPGEIRTLSLRIFDRSFAVTYWLQAVAIAIGLFGIAASFSAQVLARRKEFGLLAHLGLTRRQMLAVVAAEGAVWTAAGALLGLLLGIAVSVVLVKVVNPQSFHWTMDLRLPWPRLAALGAAVMAAGTLTAWLAARQAAGRDSALAVKEDW